MAKSGKNVLTANVTGQFGKQLYLRNSNGQSIMSKMPHFTHEPSDAVLNQNHKFKIAAPLAKEAIKDPVKRARYEAARKPGQSAYNVALSEYMRWIGSGKPEPTPTPPRVSTPDTGTKTKDITMIFDTENGPVIETGMVVPDKHLKWLLSTANKRTSQKVSKITVLVTCV